MSLLDYVKSRISEEGDCWIWPIADKSTLRISNSYYNGSVKRAVWTKGLKRKADGKFITSKCGNPLCVNPDHLRAEDVSTVRARQKKSLTHKMKVAESRRKGSKLDAQKVAEIRASNESCVALSKKYGVVHSHIHAIRVGKQWKDYTTPFQGLMR